MKTPTIEIESVDDRYSLVLMVDNQDVYLSDEQLRDIRRIIGRAVDRLRNLI